MISKSKKRRKKKGKNGKGKEEGGGPAGHEERGTAGADWAFWEPPPRRAAQRLRLHAGGRRGTEWTVESMHVPGSQARRWEPEAVTAGRGPCPPRRPPAHRPQHDHALRRYHHEGSARERSTGIHPRHADHGGRRASDRGDAGRRPGRPGGLKDECLTTYDECAVLADKAVKIRDALREIAVELAERNNVIGRLTSAAMNRLAESMDLLKRKAEQMRTESLVASEAVEVAHDEMHDAYRPVQQAALDAGLKMPSARIHNED
ncbi:hypothetical protein NKH77_56175 [Streptomyces sp. M19]